VIHVPRALSAETVVLSVIPNTYPRAHKGARSNRFAHVESLKREALKRESLKRAEEDVKALKRYMGGGRKVDRGQSKRLKLAQSA